MLVEIEPSNIKPALAREHALFELLQNDVPLVAVLQSKIGVAIGRQSLQKPWAEDFFQEVVESCRSSNRYEAEFLRTAAFLEI